MGPTIRRIPSSMIELEKVQIEIRRLQRIEADLKAKFDAKLDKVQYRCLWKTKSMENERYG